MRETLERLPREQEAYQSWKNSDSCYLLLQKIAKAYYYQKTNISSDIKVHLFTSPGANGFAINYEPIFGSKTFDYLLDYFKDQTLEQKYKIQMAERKIMVKGDWIETKDKYYLKPSIKIQMLDDQLVNQLYGNVAIELIKKDQTPLYLKLLVTHYKDHQFSEVLDYDDLIGKLLSTD